MKKTFLNSFTSKILAFNPFRSRISKTDFTRLFKRWNDALQTGKPEAVAALYSDEAVLLPTVSSEVRVGRHAIQQYFIDFLKFKPKGKILKHFTKSFDDHVCMNSGIYEFELTKESGIEKVLARYTYIYEKFDGKWMIIVHHSSVLPQSAENANQSSNVVKNIRDVIHTLFNKKDENIKH